MHIGRREFVLTAGAAVAAAVVGGSAHAAQPGSTMYGLIGKITAAAGQRDALIAILLDGVEDMPGCLSYVVAQDPADADAIWVTEVWESQASHAASLTLPAVREAISRGRPLIAAFDNQVVTTPLGGHGLSSRRAR